MYLFKKADCIILFSYRVSPPLRSRTRRVDEKLTP